MEALLHDIIQLLIRVGPWIVFLVTASETALFVGLLIPAEATVLVAAFLANSDYFELEHVILATLAGGFVGDQLGYVFGRFGGRRFAARGGRVGRLWRRYEPKATLLFRQKTLLSVTGARFISFVRTLMPWFAGMSGMPYGRFLFYDILGVLGWGLGSVAAGYLAGRSWRVMAGALGTLSTVVVAAIVIGLVVIGVRARRRMRQLKRVGLTGNIASGKSAVAEVWRKMGAVIVDADELARRAVEPGTPALREIRQRFGAGVLQGTGELDRALMREVVFSDEAKRRDLEKIVHPEVERLRLEAEREAAARGVRIVVHMIPLLFETGLQDRFDLVVLVDAPAEERRRRIVENRGITPAEADAMMQAQTDVAQKRDAADFVIDNDADLEVLAERAEQVWNEIEARLE